ncbi:hypothetical protein TBLA_0J00470 [Henningerozyma blattae CBS 6284]|uniref:Importin N-terminal domain-containing protein n=1 Tax=Henningerozyma blattae (strain ATCC 34711 / CBS 6284 / DSM 70876 / NBRC 10599 / NRRL Y-10934 / UCD 77-7) TaxID=1071380 RepID=I2H9J5_HENB6|nr:hypothetical protein TBLA_0J00470 [Tetrapisispora blattae CBS 6284]CCH63047.1 hypothetical protein TBLA_0J00470 [Tetrapisispora blattae CBS 6284]
MSSSITNLTELNLVTILQQASDVNIANPNAQRLAEQQLKLWETALGFHYLLQSIYLDLSNPLQVRWLAVIQFKNGVERYWRSTRINAISKDEKASIRNRLFEVLDEQNNQLCIQNAQATARIARLDFPSDWTNLFETIDYILKRIQSPSSISDKIHLYNLMIHLNQIIKLLSAATIGRCKPAMQSKMPLIFPSIVRIYLFCFNEWTSSSDSMNPDLIDLQLSYITLKVLRRIVTGGYDSPHKDETVCEFMKLTLSHFELLIENQANFSKFDQYEKFIRCYGKLYYNLISSSPAYFILFPCSIQILISYTQILIEKAPEVYNENSDITGDFWEQTTIRGFLILKKIINFVNKKGVITIKARSDKASIDSSIEKINNDFLNEQLIIKLLDILIEWYLKLRPIDLQNWFADPEEWINEQMSTSYEYQIRPCAENFFQDLMNSFPKLLVPYLLNKIQNNSSASMVNTQEAFLLRDSLYSSFQLSASVVSDMVDFDKLFVEVFLPTATNVKTPKDQLRIIRRRVSLIINEWSIVKCSEETKKLCYEYFNDLLMSDDDKVVQLTAIQSLKTMIDDWNFKKDSFEPFLKNVVNILLRKILPTVSLTETRLYVLNTLSDIIIQTKPLISNDLLIEILQIVPQLWEISSTNPSESILSNALLRLLKNLVNSLGPKSHLTWDIAIPAFTIACDPTSPQYALLNEDGYELWSYLLQNYSEKEVKLSSKFIDALPFLESGVEMHSEILPTLLELVKSYTLILNQQEYFSIPVFSNIFGKLCVHLLKLRDDSYYLLLQIWEILILSNESDYEKYLLQNFFSTGILTAIFDGIFQEESLSSYQCNQLLQLIGRIAYVNPNALIEFLQSYHQNLPSSVENMELPMMERKIVYKDMTFDSIINKLLSIWINCFKDLYDPKQKKLHILGMSSLLRTGLITIFVEFPNIASIWIEMLEEINETSNGDCEKYHLNDVITEQSAEFFHLTCEQVRQHELNKNNDPVHNISLKECIKQTMQFLESHLGEKRYNEFISNVPVHLIENLRLFLGISPSK